MTRLVEKRTVDMTVIGEWVEPQSRVLDLGCGRGELLDYLAQAKKVEGTGVDLDFGRGSPGTYEGGSSATRATWPTSCARVSDRHFDRVICSRTVHELDRAPQADPVQTSATRVTPARSGIQGATWVPSISTK